MRKPPMLHWIRSGHVHDRERDHEEQGTPDRIPKLKVAWRKIVSRDPEELKTEREVTGMPLPAPTHLILTRYEIATALNHQLRKIRVIDVQLKTGKRVHGDIDVLLTSIGAYRFPYLEAFREAIKAKYPDWESDNEVLKALHLLDRFESTELGGRKVGRVDIVSLLASLKQLMLLRDQDGFPIMARGFLSPHFPWVIKAAYFVTDQAFEAEKSRTQWNRIIIPLLGFWKAVQSPTLHSLLGNQALEEIIETCIWGTNEKEFRRAAASIIAAAMAAPDDQREELMGHVRKWVQLKLVDQFKKRSQSVDRLFNKLRVDKDLREANASDEFKAAVAFITAYIDKEVDAQGNDLLARMKRSRELTAIVTDRLGMRFQRRVKQDAGKKLDTVEETQAYAEDFNWHMDRQGQRLLTPKKNEAARLGVVKKTSLIAHFKYFTKKGVRGGSRAIPKDLMFTPI